jgi:hypothetical protein
MKRIAAIIISKMLFLASFNICLTDAYNYTLLDTDYKPVGITDAGTIVGTYEGTHALPAG